METEKVENNIYRNTQWNSVKKWTWRLPISVKWTEQPRWKKYSNQQADLL